MSKVLTPVEIYAEHTQGILEGKSMGTHVAEILTALMLKEHLGENCEFAGKGHTDPAFLEVGGRLVRDLFLMFRTYDNLHEVVDSEHKQHRHKGPEAIDSFMKTMRLMSYGKSKKMVALDRKGKELSDKQATANPDDVSMFHKTEKTIQMRINPVALILLGLITGDSKEAYSGVIEYIRMNFDFFKGEPVTLEELEEKTVVKYYRETGNE